MAMTDREKELAAVGISIAAGCMPCTDFHVDAARKTGTSDAEVGQAVSDALAVRRAATEVMEAFALARLGESRPAVAVGRAGQSDRTRELVHVGAALGVNCATCLEAHLAAARGAGITHDEIAALVKLAAVIKGRAESHVARIAADSGGAEVTAEKNVTGCCAA